MTFWIICFFASMFIEFDGVLSLWELLIILFALTEIVVCIWFYVGCTLMKKGQKDSKGKNQQKGGER